MTGQVWPRSGTPPGGQNQWVPASGSSLPGMTATGGLAPGPVDTKISGFNFNVHSA